MANFYYILKKNQKMRFRRNFDIDLYFGNIFLQFWINIDFCQWAVVSLSAPKFIFIVHRPPMTLHRPPVGTVDVDDLHYSVLSFIHNTRFFYSSKLTDKPIPCLSQPLL